MFIVALFASCERILLDDANQTMTSEQLILKKGDNAASTNGDKVTICHDGKAISVSINALKAHLAHGDYIMIDADGDGFYTVAGVCTGTEVDCNDNNASVHPGAEEICGDGIDNNCDGKIDEGCAPDFFPFKIRNSNSTITAPWDVDMFITENSDGNGFSCATPTGGQKVGYGTSAFDGMKVNSIETVNWDKLTGKDGIYAYMNMWVTDGTHYAIIASENNYLGTVFGTRTEWKIFETDLGNLNWLFAGGIGTRDNNQYLMKDGVRATLSDLRDNIVLRDPRVYPKPPIGTGAPRGGFGFNLIFGDTQANFIGQPYSLENVSVTIAGKIYEASN